MLQNRLEEDKTYHYIFSRHKHTTFIGLLESFYDFVIANAPKYLLLCVAYHQSHSSSILFRKSVFIIDIAEKTLSTEAVATGSINVNSMSR